MPQHHHSLHNDMPFSSHMNQAARSLFCKYAEKRENWSWLLGASRWFMHCNLSSLYYKFPAHSFPYYNQLNVRKATDICNSFHLDLYYNKASWISLSSHWTTIPSMNVYNLCMPFTPLSLSSTPNQLPTFSCDRDIAVYGAAPSTQCSDCLDSNAT